MFTCEWSCHCWPVNPAAAFLTILDWGGVAQNIISKHVHFPHSISTVAALCRTSGFFPPYSNNFHLIAFPVYILDLQATWPRGQALLPLTLGRTLRFAWGRAIAESSLCCDGYFWIQTAVTLRKVTYWKQTILCLEMLHFSAEPQFYQSRVLSRSNSCVSLKF